MGKSIQLNDRELDELRSNAYDALQTTLQDIRELDPSDIDEKARLEAYAQLQRDLLNTYNG